MDKLGLLEQLDDFLMCLALPAQIINIIDNSRAIVNLGGITKEISIELLDEVAVGDYVIIHVGYALTRLDEKEAQKTLNLFAQMMQESTL